MKRRWQQAMNCGNNGDWRRGRKAEEAAMASVSVQRRLRTVSGAGGEW